MIKDTTPQHVAIICDGNRRWARGKGLPVFKGHEFAVKNTMEELIDAASEIGIDYLTFWIFSTENWNRDKKEVEGLMNLFRYMFDKQLERLHKKNYKVKLIGNRAGLADDIQSRIEKGEELTKNNTGMTVIFAMNYGGHDELVRAVKKITEKVQSGKLTTDQITEQLVEAHLDTNGTPSPDMIIRPGGEQRMSGFMSWQNAYSEYFFTTFAFPEFTRDKLVGLVDEFKQRNRRFGGN